MHSSRSRSLNIKTIKDSPSRFFYLSLLTTLFLAVFYNTVTNMAGIYIVSDLGGENFTSVYAMVFFGLGNILSLPLTIPLSNRFGPIRVLVFCLLLYTGFSILCGIAQTFFIFNLYRFGMGVASGPFYLLCRKVLVACASPEECKTYSFFMLLLYAVVPVLGASFGAWLAYDNFWRWIFHVNEPISLFLAGYFWFFHRKRDSDFLGDPRVDKISYFFFAIGISSLLTAATLSQQLDWYRSPTLVFLTLIGVPSLLFAILWDLKSPTPLLHLRLLKNWLLSFSLINLAVLFSSYFGMIILISLWLNLYVNYTPWWITILVGTMANAGLFAYFVIKRVLERYDPRYMLGLAILFFAISCYYSTFFDVDVDLFHLAVARAIAGFGLVLFLFPLFDLLSISCASDKFTSAFTLFQLTRVLSSSLGAALYVIVWQRRQVFFHERLGEGLTINSQLTLNYFQRATEIFKLTKEQAIAQLDVYLERQATSLGLNDVFGCMGYILLALLALLVISFFKTSIPSKYNTP